MLGLARCQTRIASWGSRGVLSPTYLTISSRPLVTSHEQARCPRRHGTNQPDSPALPEPAEHRSEPSPALRTCARLQGRAVRAASRRDASRPNASRRGAACGSHVAQTALFREGRGQNALFRRVCFSSSGQTRRRLTEKRTLQPAPHGKAHSGPRPQSTPHGKAYSVGLGGRRVRLSVTSPPEGRGAQPPASLRGTMENASTGQTRSSNPPPACGGGLRQGPQASAWGLAARKGAVWAEGLADGAPWARPGLHQAASCGLRRCRELRIILTSRETVLSVKRLPREGSSPGKGKVQVTPRPGCLDVGATAAGSEFVPASTATRP